MKAKAQLGFAVLLFAILAAIHFFLGHRVLFLAGGFSLLWFGISMVLLARPPGIPEFITEDGMPDEQYVIRRDPVPRFPIGDRLQWSLCIACAASLVIWLTLGLLAV